MSLENVVIDIETAIFQENQTQSMSRFFVSKFDSILIPYRPRVTGDWCRRSLNGFYTPARPIEPKSEEFIFSTPNMDVKKSKFDRSQILRKNKIESRG